MKMALLVANRGFFPSEFLEDARKEMAQAAAKQGIELLTMDPSLTRFGAVETTQEGMKYHKFLDEHYGEYDGVIISLPNFGDENGIKAALCDVNVPVLVQAYPDEIGKMDFANRRDAFCGKLGLCSVFKQMDFKFTSGQPFVMHPLSEDFDNELRDFAAICRVVKKMRHLRVGAFGARTTAFKSVRYDEVAMERRGVEVESYDLTGLLARYKKMNDGDALVKVWDERLHAAMRFDGAPDYAAGTLARLGAALQTFVDDNSLGAVALRCWTELQDELHIAPCSLLGCLNMMGVPAACETDVSNVYPMAALHAASQGSVACCDLNNNYGSDPNKLILFHCGPVPVDMMTGPGNIEEHKMFVKTSGENCSWGLNVGRIKPGLITFAGGRTDNGECQFYMSTGEVTTDEIEAAYFGTPGVMRSDSLQRKLQNICYGGFRHHTTFTFGDWERAIDEALVKYLGYTRIDI